MKIIESFFDDCYLLQPALREDCRGFMEVFYSKNESDTILNGFEIREQRFYRMPRKFTFFGIHYQKEGVGQRKLISVIQGRGIDYIIDLRKHSDTYLQYKEITLDAEYPKVLYIPAGFGHGFLSMVDHTIQAFAVDAPFENERTGVISYKDPNIGLKLPTQDIILSDYDSNAAFLQ